MWFGNGSVVEGAAGFGGTPSRKHRKGETALGGIDMERGVCGGRVGRVLERLESAGKPDLSEAELVVDRLERVRALGGAFARVELSEHFGAGLLATA